MQLKPLALVAPLALIALGLGGCGKSRELAYKDVQIKELERYNAELEAQLAAKDAEIAQLKQGSFPPPVQADPTVPQAGDGVDWSSRGGDAIVATISNEVLFRPGSAVLSDKAKKALDSVIDQVKSKYPGHDVRVEGHTDSQPVKRSKDEHKDNWDLSGNRAQAVLHYLLDHGVAAKQLGFAGYGMERPVASNSSPAGMTKNRRVEIVILKPQARASE